MATSHKSALGKAGELGRRRNPMASAVRSPVFKQRIVKSKSQYTRKPKHQQDAALLSRNKTYE
jgi:hypothetical protein